MKAVVALAVAGALLVQSRTLRAEDAPKKTEEKKPMCRSGGEPPCSVAGFFLGLGLFDKPGTDYIQAFIEPILSSKSLFISPHLGFVSVNDQRAGSVGGSGGFSLFFPGFGLTLGPGYRYIGPKSDGVNVAFGEMRMMLSNGVFLFGTSFAMGGTWGAHRGLFVSQTLLMGNVWD